MLLMVVRVLVAVERDSNVDRLGFLLGLAALILGSHALDQAGQRPTAALERLQRPIEGKLTEVHVSGWQAAPYRKAYVDAESGGMKERVLSVVYIYLYVYLANGIS